jgi:ferrous iron transport protein A
MFPLALLAVEEVAEVVGIAAGVGGEAAARVEELGLRAGRRVRMLANGSGPVLVKVDEARVALDRGVALRINVRRA